MSRSGHLRDDRLGSIPGKDKASMFATTFTDRLRGRPSLLNIGSPFLKGAGV
jgi:hypothetical protein